MQAIRQQTELPRFHKEFIGIGHTLQQKRRERRRVEMEQRAMANRVLFLQKEQLRAQRSLLKKREEFGRLMGVAERQAQEKEQRGRVMAQRQRQLQLIREENRLQRVMHRQNQQRSQALMSARNSLDYKLSKQHLSEFQSRKRDEQMQDLMSKRQRYESLNARREVGRSRIDKFFKQKNTEHTKTYKEKISKEQGNAMQKMETIKRLGEIEGVLRHRLEESSMRVSQMDQALGNISQSFRDKTGSRLSLGHSLSVSPDVSLITSMEGTLLARGEVEEEIEEGGEGGVSEGGKVRRRRRNKHVNRYKEYELF